MLKRPYYPSPLIMLPYLLVGMITSPMMELPTIGPPLSLLEMLDQPFRKGYPQDTLPITTSQDVFYFRCACDVSPLFRWNVSSRVQSLIFLTFWILMLLQPAYATMPHWWGMLLFSLSWRTRTSPWATTRRGGSPELNFAAKFQPPVVPCIVHSQLRQRMRKTKDDLRVSNFRNPPNMAMTCVGCHFFNVFHVVNLKKQCPILRELQYEDLSKTSPSLGDDSLSIVGVILHSWWVRTTESRIVLDYCNSYYRLSLSCLNKYSFAVNFPLKPIGSNDWEHLNHY